MTQKIIEVGLVEHFSRKGYLALGVIFFLLGILTSAFAVALPRIAILFFGILSLVLGVFTIIYGVINRHTYGIYFPLGAGFFFSIMGIICTFFSNDVLLVITWLISFAIFFAGVVSFYFWYITRVFRASIGFLIDGVVMVLIAISMWIIGGFFPDLFSRLTGYFFSLIWFSCSFFILFGLLINYCKRKAMKESMKL